MNKVFNVKGMHCHSCGLLIESFLEDFDGVKKVEVSVNKGLVSVVFDESKVVEMKLKDAIVRHGYEVV